MKWLFYIFFFSSGILTFAQRPDLSIGVQAKTRFLNNYLEQVSFITPGISFHMQVAKRAGSIGVETGYWTTINMNQSNLYSPQHTINVNVSPGLRFIHMPAFKLLFLSGISNNFSLVSNGVLEGQNLFSRYALQLIPELSFNYKYLIGGVTYTIPVVGTNIKGPGIKFGITL